MSESEGSYQREQQALEDLEQYCMEELALQVMEKRDDYLVWYNKDGECIPYAKLSNKHLSNIDAMLNRKGIRLPNLRAEVGRRMALMKEGGR